MIENSRLPPKLFAIMEVAEATKTSLTVETKTIALMLSDALLWQTADRQRVVQHS